MSSTMGNDPPINEKSSTPTSMDSTVFAFKRNSATKSLASVSGELGQLCAGSQRRFSVIPLLSNA